MNIQEIVMANCTGMVLLLISIFSRFITRRKRQTEDKFFNALLLIGMIGCCFELISFLVDGKDGFFNMLMNYFSNTLIYCCTTTVSVIWLWYTDTMINRNIKRIKTVFLPFVIVGAILIVILIVNIPTGFIFKISNDNIYSRTNAGYIYYAFLFASLITTIVIYFVSRIRHGKTVFFPIHMFLIPVIASCIIQVIWYGIASAWLGCAVGLTGIYVDILSRNSMIDSLTRLPNRSYLEHSFRVIKEKGSKYAYAGIMFDVDYFKRINDTYGHSVGDEALRDAARILTDSIDRNSFAFRFAGDEFIVLVKLPIERKGELEKAVNKIKNNVRIYSEKFNKSTNKYQINFSIGHALYDPEKPIDDFFRSMDFAMYLEKKEHHKDKQN